MTRLSGVLLPFLLSLCGPLYGQSVAASESHTEHTFRLSDGESRPAATLADASWLVGSWTGTAFGQQFEEIWSEPSAGSMVGMFKLLDGEDVSFYELMLMTVDDGTLSLKVKHFNADFSAWEEKGDFVDFRLVAFTENELHFSGISFYKRRDDHIDGYIVMRNKEEITEHHLKYERRD
jgi:hypothetical protein